MVIKLAIFIIIMVGTATAGEDEDDDFSGELSGDNIDITCDGTDRPVTVTVTGTREVTESDLEILQGHIADQATSYCSLVSSSFCSLLLGSNFSPFEAADVDACVSESSSNERRKRQSTITTTIAVRVVDPDQPSRSLDGSDIEAIANLAVDDFESDTGFTVEEVQLGDEDDEDDDYDYLVIAIGAVVFVVILVILLLSIIAITVIAILLKKKGKKNRVNPIGERRPLQSSNGSTSSDSLLSTHEIH